MLRALVVGAEGTRIRHAYYEDRCARVHAAGERGTGSRRQRSSVPPNKRQRAGKHNSFTRKRTVQSRFRAVLDPGRPRPGQGRQTGRTRRRRRQHRQVGTQNRTCAEGNGSRRTRILKGVMMSKVNTQIGRKSSKTVASGPGRPRRASKAYAVQPANWQRGQVMAMKRARKSDAVKRTVAHDEGIRDARKQLRMNLAETWRTSNSGRVNAVNPDMPRIEPFVRIDQSLPGRDDNPGTNADEADLADTGAISIRGLEIKGDEGRKRSGTGHSGEILTVVAKQHPQDASLGVRRPANANRRDSGGNKRARR